MGLRPRQTRCMWTLKTAVISILRIKSGTEGAPTTSIYPRVVDLPTRYAGSLQWNDESRYAGNAIIASAHCGSTVVCKDSVRDPLLRTVHDVLVASLLG